MIETADNRTNIKTEKKSRILEAAALLFSKRQYHEVMIEEVARLAFIAKGTVYNYFSSKEEIYFTIIREKLNNLITSLEQKIQSDRDSSRALKSFVTHLYMFMMKYKEFFLMYSREIPEADNQLCGSINKMQQQLRDMLKDILVAGISSGAFRKIDPGFAADLILGNIYASVNRGIDNGFNENEMVREREETFNFIYEGMSVHKLNLPLEDKIIVLTRTEEQNRESAPLFESAGAAVISFPALKVVPDDGIDLENYLKDAPDYIVFMSGNAVKIFAEKLGLSGKKIETDKTLVAAVGNKTAEQCTLNNITPDIIPGENSAAGLIGYFRNMNIEAKKFLIPRSAQGRDEFIRFLEEKNALPLPVNIYSTVSPALEEAGEKTEKLFNAGIDVIVFASPSAFTNFLSITGDRGKELLGKVNIAAIGKTTESEIMKNGFLVNILPREVSLEGLKNSIIDFYQKEKQ